MNIAKRFISEQELLAYRRRKTSKSVLYVNESINLYLEDVVDNIDSYFKNRGYKIYKTPNFLPKFHGLPNKTAVPAKSRPLAFSLFEDCFDSLARKIKVNHSDKRSLSTISDLLRVAFIPFGELLLESILLLKPKYLVIGGDSSPEFYYSSLIAKELGIQTLALEICFQKEYFNLEEHTGSCCNNHSFGTWMWHYNKKISLSKTQKNFVRGMIKNRNRALYTSTAHTSAKASKPSLHKIANKLDIPKDSKAALILCQLPYDSVITNDLHSFKSLNEFVLSAIEAFEKETDWHLIVRLHPLEVDSGSRTLNHFTKGKFSNKRTHFVLGQEINTYDLINFCSFGLTINSQSGLEMLMEGKQVILTGDSFYGNKGFTIDISHKSFLNKAIQIAKKNPSLSKKQLELRDKFLFFYFDEFLCKREPLEIEKRLNLLEDRNNTDRMNQKTFAKEFRKTWKSYHSNEFEADLRDVMKTIPPKGFNTLIWGIGSLAEALCSQAKGRFPNLTFCHSAGMSRSSFLGHACQNSEDVDYQDFDMIILTPRKESKNIFTNQILPRLTQKKGQKFFYLDSKKDQLFLRRIRL